MQRALAAVAVALLLIGMAAPGLEAFVGCSEDCPDDFQGRCGDGMCCSCCMFAPPATLTGACLASPSFLPSFPGALPEGAALPGEGIDLLHVPKAVRA